MSHVCDVCSIVYMNLLFTRTCLYSEKWMANNANQLAFHHECIAMASTFYIDCVQSTVDHCFYSAIMSFSICAFLPISFCTCAS